MYLYFWQQKPFTCSTATANRRSQSKKNKKEEDKAEELPKSSIHDHMRGIESFPASGLIMLCVMRRFIDRIGNCSDIAM